MSEPSSQRSASVVRQDISDYVLKHADKLSDVPGVKEFVEEHGQLTKEIAATTKRGKRLAKAKEKYEPFEKNVLDCQDALTNAEAELAKRHRPLGQAAIKAFLGRSIEEQAIFSERVAVHKRIQELRLESDGLSTGSDAGIVQKAKAKAQQLAIAGKVKLEEMKCGGMESDIGRQLIESELDESVRCDSTSGLLEQVADNRESLSACSSQFQEADAARENAVNQLCKAIPLKHIESSKTFDTEMKSCKKTVRESESALAKTTRSVIVALAAIDSSKLPEPLTVKLDELKTAKDAPSEQMRVMANQTSSGTAKRATSAKSIWTRLSNRAKITVGIASCILIIGIAFSGGSGHKPELTESETASTDSSDDYIGQLNSMDNRTNSSMTYSAPNPFLGREGDEILKDNAVAVSDTDHNPAPATTRNSTHLSPVGLLTADYLPHKFGAVANYRDSILTRAEYRHVFYPKGRIALFVNGEKQTAISQEEAFVRRLNNEFIDLFHSRTELVDLRIKIGAKAGDSWTYKSDTNHQVNAGHSTTWELLGFETYTPKIDWEPRKVAVIKKTQFDRGRTVSVATIRLMEGVGLLEREVQVLQNPPSRYRLVEGIKNPSSAELAFFDTDLVKETIHLVSQPSQVIDNALGDKTVPSHLEFSPDGDYLLCTNGRVAGSSKSVLLKTSDFTVVGRGLARTFSRRGKYIYGVFQLAQEMVPRKLASLDRSNAHSDGLFIHQVTTGKPILQIQIGGFIGIGAGKEYPFQNGVDSFVVDSTDLVLVNEAGIGDDSGIKVLTIQGSEIGTIKPRDGQNRFQEAAVSPDGRQLLTIGRRAEGYGRLVDVWDIKKYRFLKSVQYGDRHKAFEPSFSKSGRYCAMRMGQGAERDYGGDIVIWDTSDWSKVRALPQEERSNFKFGAWGPNDEWIATIEAGGMRANVKMWELRTGNILGSIDVEGTSPFYFSSDGRKILSISGWHTTRRDAKNTLDVWNIETGKMLARVEEWAVGTAALSPDGNRLATTSTDHTGTIKLWDLTKGRKIPRHEALPHWR